jgi:pimeloyl-ACP methyl ester carboxylesterase
VGGGTLLVAKPAMSEVLSADGTAIAFDRSGDGPPVIFVDGAFMHRSFGQLPRLGALLAPRFTAINYDRRGRGESADTAPYAVQREVDDLDALIAEAGGSASVFGISSGAALALEAAASGLSIGKLALYEPPFIVSDSRPPTPNDFAAQLNELISSGRRGQAVEHFLTKGVGEPPGSVAATRAMPLWAQLEAVAHTLAYDATIMGRGNSLPDERLARVTAPTLVIDGGASPAWMHSAARAATAALPDAQHRTLAGQGHDVAPDVLAPVLEEFFGG